MDYSMAETDGEPKYDSCSIRNPFLNNILIPFELSCCRSSVCSEIIVSMATNDTHYRNCQFMHTVSLGVSIK